MLFLPQLWSYCLCEYLNSFSETQSTLGSITLFITLQGVLGFQRDMCIKGFVDVPLLF